MLTRTRDPFTTVRTEGALLPPDLLQRVAEGDRTIEHLQPSDYHLVKGEKHNEAINRSWNRLQGAWASFQSAREKFRESEPGTSPTRERWLLPLFEELKYGRLQTTKAFTIDGKDYPISHVWQKTPIHLVGCNIDLGHRTPGVAGAARTSPHSLVQEFLNRSDDHLWAFLSNGLHLRILRDNISLTRQAFVEFDLAGMMEGQVYTDFALLWLLCHQSRVEAERPEQCVLETWAQAAHDLGTRSLDRLRDGVEEAITALGAGFISHPANTELQEKLESGDLTTQDYYRQLLRVVYRLIFLFVAENRALLFPPGSQDEAKRTYRRYYSTDRLRRLAGRRRGTQHTDLWNGLRVVLEKLGSDTGCPEVALPALGSFLWSTKATPELDCCELANKDLLQAIRSLAFAEENGVLRQVDYKNLGAEELGSVYEALLELHPEINLDAGTFSLTTAAGHERKTTGSYYTPTSLINCLLDTALDPVLDEKAKAENPEQAILAMKVCDPACGSGHFLIAAGHRIARRLAAVRTGDEEPSPEATRTALRDVVGHCLYGVDINPMAVELCKINLWLEALEPGKPLSFLEHRIQCGNSLLGSTPALLEKGIPDDAFKPIEGDDREFCREYKRRNKEEREGQLRLLEPAQDPWERLGDFAASMVRLESQGDRTPAGIHKKEELWEELVRSSGYEYGHLWADAWCAAFVWKKRETPDRPYPITEEVFRKIEKNPHSVPAWLRKEVRRLSNQYQFFHWTLAFPGVFPSSASLDSAERCAVCRGFDVIVGNPPWEKVKLQEREWFSARRPDIAEARTAAIRREMIQGLAQEDPALLAEFESARRSAEGETHIIRNSQRYPLGAKGDTNTYPIFLELGSQQVADAGRVGLIVKTGILADFSLRDFFANLVDSERLVTAYDFSNRKLLFPGVVANERFTLITLAGVKRPHELFELSVLNDEVSDLVVPGARWSFSRGDVDLVNPNTRTCPLFQSTEDALLVRVIYARQPILIREGKQEQNPWGALYYRMFDMSNDSGLFRDLESLLEISPEEPCPAWQTGEGRFVALLEGKLFDQFDHRHGTFEGVPRARRFRRKAQPNHFSDAEKNDPSRFCLPRYWAPAVEANERYRTRTRVFPNGVLTFRDVCRTHTDLRTVRAAITPAWAAGNKAPLLLFPTASTGTDHARRSLLLCANLNAFVFDYVARQKFSGGSLNRFILIQLPFLGAQDAPALWDQSLGTWEWLNHRAIELVYTTWDLGDFAGDCEIGGPPFRWLPDRRFLLRCELDAAFLHLYLGEREKWGTTGEEVLHVFGSPRDAVSHIMETFPILRRRDIEEYGDYRTKLTILDIYDRMQHAIDTGEPYKTLLDPPPADPRVAHSSSESSVMAVVTPEKMQ